jgi:hypothetical protein
MTASATIAGVYTFAVGALLAAFLLARCALGVTSMMLHGVDWSAISSIDDEGGPTTPSRLKVTCTALAALVALMCARAGVLLVMRKSAWARDVLIARMMPVVDRPSKANAERVSLTERVAGRWLFSTPASSEWNPLDYNIVSHGPMYGAMLCYFAFIHWPAWLARAAVRRMCTGQWTRPTTDGDVLDAITGTSLIMLTTNNSVSGKQNTLCELAFRTPADFPLCLLDDTPLSSFEIVFDVPQRRIVRASLPGFSFCGESTNSKLLACLAQILQTHVHPKLHIEAERSAFEIALAECTALEPSSRFVRGLHEGLFFAASSPIRVDSALNSGTSINNLAHTIPFPLSHTLDSNLRVFPFYDFMWQAHAIVARLAKKHCIPSCIDRAALTANTVLHAVDHYSATLHFSPDQACFAIRAPTLGDYLRFDLWISFWTPASICWSWNPLENEFINRMRTPFYRELHQQLHAIDPELARHIVASCSF